MGLVVLRPVENCWKWWTQKKKKKFLNRKKAGKAKSRKCGSRSWTCTILFHPFTGFLFFFQINTYSSRQWSPVGWSSRMHRLHLCRGVRPPPMSVLDMTLSNLMVRVGNVEYSSNVTTPRSTLVQSGSTWLGPIYESNITVCHLNRG